MEQWLRVVACLALATACREPEGASRGDPAAAARETARRPHLVLVIVDTLRADKLGAYGHPGETSPEIDRYAREGVQFLDVLAPSSWTRPSTGTLLTGLQPRTLGLYEEAETLDARFVTLAETLRDAGYSTFGITANPVLNRVFGMAQGFDTYVDSDVVFPWMTPEGDQLPFRGHSLRSAREIFEAVLEAPALRGPGPHFVQINVMDVHEYRRKGHTLTRDEFRPLFRGEREGNYLRAVRQVSHDLDLFIRALSARPGWEDTLYVITSDHGQGLHDHPDVPLFAFAHGWVLYESQVKVPLILYHPGRLAPQRVARRVRLLDLMPTLLDHLGLEPEHAVQGTSLLPLLRGGEVTLPRYFVTETHFRQVERIAAYGPRWKYFENRDRHPGIPPVELQAVGRTENGLRTDRRGEQPGVAAEMGAFLARWEADNPPTPSTPVGGALPEETAEQLRAIGYLE